MAFFSYIIASNSSSRDMNYFLNFRPKVMHMSPPCIGKGGLNKQKLLATYFAILLQLWAIFFTIYTVTFNYFKLVRVFRIATVLHFQSNLLQSCSSWIILEYKLTTKNETCFLESHNYTIVINKQVVVRYNWFHWNDAWSQFISTKLMLRHKSNQ